MGIDDLEQLAELSGSIKSVRNRIEEIEADLYGLRSPGLEPCGSGQCGPDLDRIPRLVDSREILLSRLYDLMGQRLDVMEAVREKIESLGNEKHKSVLWCIYFKGLNMAETAHYMACTRRWAEILRGRALTEYAVLPTPGNSLR